ncbi:hypothetical protein [Candidatus Nitrospira neomarina]|uniref:Uncharacterized protein n=1 Tax=Candidatus Nitrospira neomarina TaxID=3020899 RepID=A0AA96GFL5_9BACT|nr:hypothetical protein [Candidatus Nitrospira neomarina]WNM60908.1 hypothetical protein PQG83_14225 [Candidatus Nitrospira neomarina]
MLAWSIFIVGPLIVPLLYSATIFVYLACLAPLVVCWNKERLLWPGVLFSLVLCTAVAFLPSWLSEKRAAWMTERITVNDFRATAPVTGRSLEIIRESDYTPQVAWRPFAKDSWGEVWETLLISGQVDWIRFSTHQDGLTPSKIGEVQKTSYFEPVKGYHCQIPGLPVQAEQHCIRLVKDPHLVADIQILFHDMKRTFPFEPDAFWLIKPVRWRMVSIQNRQDNAYQEVFRQSESTIQTIFRPLVFQPEGSGTSSAGTTVMWSIGKHYNAINLGAILKDLGYDLSGIEKGKTKRQTSEDLKGPPTEEQRQLVLWILEQPGHEPFNQEQSRVISDWIARASGYEEWTPERIAFLRKIIRDPRLTFASNFDTIFRRHKEVTKALLPDVLDTIEAKGIDRQQNAAYKGGFALKYLNADLLAPHANRILQLMQSRPGETREQLLYVVGKIGINPIPILGSINLQNPGQYTAAQIKGLCRAELRWSEDILSVLRPLITSNELHKERASPYEQYVLRALARHGDSMYAKKLLDQAHWSNSGSIQRQISSNLNRYRNSEIHCA